MLTIDRPDRKTPVKGNQRGRRNTFRPGLGGERLVPPVLRTIASYQIKSRIFHPRRPSSIIHQPVLRALCIINLKYPLTAM